MVRNLLVMFVGTLAVLAFSPFNLWWMSIVSLSFLLILFHQGNYQNSFKVGYLYGLGMFGAGTSWVFNSLYDYGEAPFVAAAIITLISVLVLSLFPAFVLSAVTKLSLSNVRPIYRVLAFASLWVLLEWLRNWVLTGFPWLLFGHALVGTPFSGIIPIFGVFGGSLFIAFFAAGINEVLLSQLKQGLRWAISLSTLACIIFFLGTAEWTSPATDQQIKVAAVQANIPFEMKWDKSRRDEVYQRYVDLTRLHWDSEIVVWPETAIPTFYRVAEQNFIPSFEEELKNNDTELLSGVFTYEVGTERIFNSLVTLGNERQFYSKQHLVPFGEYLPLRWIFDFFRKIVVIPMSDLSPGEGSSVMQLKGIPVGVSICYEAAFGEEIIRALPQAQLLVNVSNDAWFGNSFAPHQHLQIARTRSLETGRYMLRATNTGTSALIDPKGDLLSQTGQFVDEVVSGEIWPMHGRTPFIIWGNWGIISIISALLLLIFFQSRRENSY